MTRDLVNSRVERVVLTLAAALIWILTGTAIAPGRSPGLPEVPKAAGQSKPRPARQQAQRVPAVLTGISPNSAPQGGIGELVLTGRNFLQGMALTISGVEILRVKVESPERAVATIQVPDNTREGRCDLTLQWWYTANGEISPSPQGTPEVAQIAKSVSFTISNSSPMLALLGEYTLIPEEELKVMNSQAASGQQMKQQAEANRVSKGQEQQIKKQGDEMKEMRDKYKRGEITQAEYMAYAMKAASGMMGQMTPQQKAATGQQMAGTAQMVQSSQKLVELQKQEKNGELRLKQGSISFVEREKALFTEPVSALKEIAVVPPPAGEKVAHDFQMGFADGKKYFFRPGGRAEDAVRKLQKRLGK